MTDAPSPPPGLSDELTALAAAEGVQVRYDDADGRPRQVSPDVVLAVLAALGHDGLDAGAEAVARARTAVEEVPWRRVLPPVVVARATEPPPVPVTVPSGSTVEGRVRLADGTTQPLEPPGPPLGSRSVDGRALVQLGLRLPAGLPLGDAVLEVDVDGTTARTPLVVVPDVAPVPPSRVWGWSVQLYATRSERSWGVGDAGDLRDLVAATAADGAGAVLVNPLHAPAPVEPREPSPYFPTSRRFRDPLLIRVEDVPELASAPADVREAVERLGRPLQQQVHEDRIDRDAAWRAKREALALLWAQPRDPRREQQLAAFREDQGEGLEDFALFSALAERHGAPWTGWPADLQDPSSEAVAQARAELADDVSFVCWQQLLVDEQLAAVADAAREGGAGLGVLHDLAVGVDAGGADGWRLQDVVALGATVGAPPDPLGPLGQDWRLPPWHPRHLAEAQYGPFRAMVRSVLRHAGGLRVDHVLGLFRLWWIPEGRPPTEGAYVRYDADALLGLLALEATRAGAVLVGEDLGTVEPGVREVLADRGVLGSSVLWFEREDDGRPLPPQQWRPLTLASVTTHDLPTAAGWLRDAGHHARAERGLLEGDVAVEEARVAREREQLVAALRDGGLVPDADDLDEEERLVHALHAALLASPCRVVLAQLADGVGDRRQPNLPGTTDEYPNWRLPLAGPDGRPVTLQEALASPRTARLAALLAGRRSADAGG